MTARILRRARCACVFALLLGACKASPPLATRPKATVEMPPSTSPAPTKVPPYEGCATMRQVEIADVVRLDDHRLVVATALDEVIGYDVTDVDHPTALGRVRSTGVPAALFVRSDVALLASREPSSLRVIGLARGSFSVKQEIALEGTIRDVHAVDDVLYVLRDDGRSPLVSSFRLDRGTLRHRSDVRLGAGTESFTVGATKILTARALEGATELQIANIDVDPLGRMEGRGSVRLRGSPSFAVEPSLDVDERFARVLTCSTTDCRSNDEIYVSVVDLSDDRSPIVASTLDLPTFDGDLVGAFDDDRLYVTGNIGIGRADATSAVRVVDLSAPALPRLSKPVELRGSIASFVPLGVATDRVLTIGSRGTPSTRLHIEIHELDVHGPTPRLRSTSEVGEDFTATHAAVQPSSVGLADDREWIALPFSSWNEREKRHVNGMEILRRTPRGLVSAGAATQEDWVDRVLFIDGRAVAISAEGLTVAAVENGPPRIIYPAPISIEGTP